jgi:hypothetical protein
VFAKTQDASILRLCRAGDAAVKPGISALFSLYFCSLANAKPQKHPGIVSLEIRFQIFLGK